MTIELWVRIFRKDRKKELVKVFPTCIEPEDSLL